MLTGLYGGLLRLGWALPPGERLAELHGPLLVCGLFGTVISLERAVALGRDAAYAAPAFAALGSLSLLAGLPPAFGALAYVLAAAALSAATLVITTRQPALFTATLSLGALSWLAGNLLWLAGRSVPDVTGWWLAFLILTIAGERLELSRLTAPKRGSVALFALAVLLLLAGVAYGIIDRRGAAMTGLALTTMTAWLARHDVVRITLRQTGQTRFMAACMAAGYAWLGGAGVLLLAAPPATATFGYDAALHAVLVGFVLSMVFGHALIILPAVARVRLAYRPILYVPLVVLHASVALRVMGDMLAWPDGRAWSGPLTVVALLGFVATLAGTAAARRV
ncbi:hypothetical protein BLTE_02620 [Blastochloris tepida]|uniref:NnrS family protein n=2 Tax=Blastochloris tepida TaxID=2233851 RepID=A0A348FW94_9HYPH|nr:hypothetical protein BLTE_02620 [Blastochloris tepida]